MAVASDRAGFPTAVITGGSAGVGRAAAVAFARRGWGVALIARGQRGLDGAKRDVESAGGRGLTLPADVADPDALAARAEEVMSEWGRIDVWINDAMAPYSHPPRQSPPPNSSA